MANLSMLVFLMGLIMLVHGGHIWKVIEESNKKIKKGKPSSDSFGEDAVGLKYGDVAMFAAPALAADTSGPVQWHRELWSNRVIPYVINHPGTSSQTANVVASVIQTSMTEIQNSVCLSFRPKITSDKFWIEFYKSPGCFSGIGRKYYSENTPTRISLGENCVSKEIVVHEILHSLGFYHEQSRRDRDSYVKIYPDRIQPDMFSNFDMVMPYEQDTVGTPYDLKSIMHYDKTAFTNGASGNTIENKFDPNMELGGASLSATDIAELKEIYQCSVTSGWSRWFGWSECISDRNLLCRRYKVRYCVGQDTSLCPGADAYGSQEMSEDCVCSGFTVNGQWNNWEAYGACSATCDWGVQKRYRKCDNPPPSNGGQGCSGISMEVNVCRVRRCLSSTFDVDFDASFGSWTTTGRLGMQPVSGFTRRSGQGISPNTGPKGDHPTGAGSYAVWPGVDGMFNSKAQLISPIVPAGSRRCLIFHYQLNGANINPTGALSAYVRDINGGYVNLAFNLGGHQGNYWRRAAVNIPPMAIPFTINFEASIGYDKQSDVAVDQIFLDENQCQLGLEGCNDLHSSCQGWSSVGECIKNPVWMSRECCASCSAMGDCVNTSSFCGGWAGNGECSKNPTWMWKNCCESCRLAFLNCFDTNTNCKLWADAGECTRNPTWMLPNCCASCKSV